MFTLAHLSDVHLGPLPRAERLSDYFGKRLIGYNSWRFRRRAVHDPAIADAVMIDIKARAPDHVAITGDLVNLAFPSEFASAAQWLRAFGRPDWITFVPGNHDAYVPVGWETGMGLWADYMTGDMRVASSRPHASVATPMPFVRQRRNVALIGVSSAVPQSWGKAGGSLGARQIEHLATILSGLRERGFCRIVLIHHPPLPGLAPDRKALSDAGALRDLLVAEGAELVLHGHNHRPMQGMLGKTRIVGVPSASSRGGEHHAPAEWNLYHIVRKDSVWQVDVTRRVWDKAAGAMADVPPEALEPAPDAR
jgi:3',5'-cyclic AMP phosphodiesterase CpdA